MTDREPIVQRRVNVLVDSGLHRQLRHESIALSQPMALIIERALKQYFDQEDSNDVNA